MSESTSDRKTYPRLCEHHAKVAVLAAFSGRKGHGGAVNITRRVLTPAQLEEIVTDACKRIARDIDDAYLRERRSTR